MTSGTRKKSSFKKGMLAFLKSPWTPGLLTMLIIALVLGTHFYSQRKDTQKKEYEEKYSGLPVDTLSYLLKELFIEYGVSWRQQANPKWPAGEWFVKIPADLPLPSFHLAIQAKINCINAGIMYAKDEPHLSRVIMDIGWADSSLCKLYLTKGEEIDRATGKIALIIDDFGAKWNSTIEAFLAMGSNITVSVLPGQRLSTKVVKEARKKGCEVILHLPMEPLSAPFKDDGYIILAKMPQYKIRDVIQRSLNDVPGISGVNNHMGSKVTSDRQTITDVLYELKKRNLYFLDSRTSSSSIAYDVAKQMGMRCGKRDIFFDVDTDKKVIRHQIKLLADKASSRGFAVGIGHCYKNTYEVLAEEIPKYQKKGYVFVTLSEVIR